MKTNEKFFKAICFFGESYSQFCINFFDKIDNVDLIVFSKNVFLNLNGDLQSESDKKVFKELLFLSKKFDCVLVCQTLLKIDKTFQNSALVFEKGKMLGICQEVGEFMQKTGESVNLYDFSFGRVGILLGNNCKTSEFFELCTSFKCDMVLCFCDDNNYKEQSLIANYFLQRNKLTSFLIFKNNAKFFCEHSVLKQKKLLKLTFKKPCLKTEKNNFFYLHKVIFENEKNFKKM